MQQWFAVLLHSSVVTTLTNAHKDFGTLAGAALDVVAGRLGVEVGQLRLVAAHDWDVYGALRAACRAAFIARGERTYYPTYNKPDVISAHLNKVTDQILELDI